MRRNWKASVLGFALMATNAMAQTNTNTFPNSGNVGIGTTTTPPVPLEVSTPTGGNPDALGIIRTGGNIAGEGPSFSFFDYSDIYPQAHIYSKMVNLSGGPNTVGKLVLGSYGGWNAAYNDELTLDVGKIGINTTSPSAPLTIWGPPTQSGSISTPIIDVYESPNNCSGCTNPGLIGERITMNQTPGWGSTNVGLWVSATNGTVGNIAAIFQNGNVGIGTTTPGASLEVNGNLKLTSGSGASITFPDNTTQATAWTGSLCGGDYAESVDVSGDRQNYEAGDVLVLDPSAPGKFLKVIQPYSTLVAGIYSTKPGVLGRRQTTDPKLSTTEVPMAMVGVVPTKVSAENGPIKIGDLLVTSTVAGHAMKGTDRGQMLGAIVGKAMGSMESGTGVIEVLVTLQ